MKITELRKDHRDFFADMDPLMFLERAELPDRECLAAFITEEDDESAKGKDIPAGLLIYRKTKESLMIEWVCVRAEYRYDGVGSELVDKVFNIAQENGMDTVEIYLNGEFGRDEICPGEEDYIDDFLFSGEKELFGEWLIETRTLLKSAVCSEPDPKDFECKCLKDIAPSQLNSDLKALVSREDFNALYDMSEYGFGPIDRETGFISYMGNKPSGVILTVMSGETLYVTGFLASRKSEAGMLARYAIKAAGKKYGGSQEVRIIKYTEDYTDIIEAVAAGLKGVKPVKNTVYSADVKKHIETVNAFEPDDVEVTIGYEKENG